MPSCTSQTIVVDFRHRSSEPKFLARLVWQALFNLYVEHGGNTNNLDNLLCDYDALCGIMQGHHNDTVRYWTFCAKSGDTELSEYPQFLGKTFEITFRPSGLPEVLIDRADDA